MTHFLTAHQIRLLSTVVYCLDKLNTNREIQYFIIDAYVRKRRLN